MITGIEVTQDNTVEGCDLLAVHNPVVYIITMTLDDSGDPFDQVIEVDVNTSGNETEFIGTFEAVFLNSPNPNTRIYIFTADEILRSGLNTPKDYDQSFNSKVTPTDDVIDEYLVKGYYITFRADTLGVPIEQVEELSAANAARDFEAENGAAMVAECTNQPKIYISGENKEVYTYDFGGQLSWWYAEIPNNIVENSIVNAVTEVVPWGNYNDYMRRGLITYNNLTDVIIKFNLQFKAVPVVASHVQLGGNRQESLDNLLAKCNSIMTPTLKNFIINSSPGGSATDQSLYFTDSTGYYKPGFAAIEAYEAGYALPGDDGKNLWFNYTDATALTHEIRLTAKIVPVLATDFEINADPLTLIANVTAVFTANYPTIVNTILPVTLNKPPFNDNQIRLAWQAPEAGTNYLFTPVDIDQTNKGTLVGSDPLDIAPEDRNPVYLRKKILADQSTAFEVIMREVTHVVYVKPFCDNSIYIKYLDRNGEYRFHVGETPSKNTRPRKIGDIDRLVTSLKTDLGDKINVGYNGVNTIILTLNGLRNDRSFNLSGGGTVYLDEIALMQDFLNSNDVQLLINNKWISVIQSGGGRIAKAKGSSISPSISFTLPKSYNITKL